MSKTYYILRHAQTLATLKGTGYGLQRITAPILESGKPAIVKMAEFLKDIPTDLNVSSPLPRCRQTTQIITNVTGKKFVIDWRLNEIFVEPFRIFSWRIKNFLDQTEKSDFNSILICTHGACIAGLVDFLTEKKLTAANLNSYPLPGILIKIEAGKLEQYDFN